MLMALPSVANGFYMCGVDIGCYILKHFVSHDVVDTSFIMLQQMSSGTNLHLGETMAV